MSIDEQQVSFRDAVQGVKRDTPLPAKVRADDVTLTWLRAALEFAVSVLRSRLPSAMKKCSGVRGARVPNFE
jgi:hypothetical protein